MNRRIRDLWTAALRSGRYRQGHGKLTRVRTVDDVPEYCCLGVLCELAAQEGVVEAREGVSFSDSTHVVYGDETNYLPIAVQRWAELPSHNPPVDLSVDLGNVTLGDQDTLAGMNDDGRTFAEIADVIERVY